MMRKASLKILFTLLLLALSSYSYLHWQWSPYGKGGSLFVPKGSSMAQVAQDLEKLKLIRQAWSFRLLAKIKKAERGIQVGEYQFKANISASEILDKLLRGDRIVHKLTIPEGYHFKQIMQSMVEAKLGSAEEIEKKFTDPQLLKHLPFQALSLEGYLYPATYEYDGSTSADYLLRQMLKKFQEQFDSDMQAQTKAMGWSIPELVTLASIIEKETGLASERKLISSVFHNRLKKGMRLATDPTVIYGIKNFDGNIRKRDLRDPHPYNTYVHPGLPPGPIASPGKASLLAALHPEKSEYLYFVSKGDGSHYFSKTYEEHRQAVQKFQLGN